MHKYTVLAVVAVSAVLGEVRLPKIYANHMVLQYDSPTVFGWADPGSTVDVAYHCSYRGLNTTVSATAAAGSGRFSASISPQGESQSAEDSCTVTVSQVGSSLNAVLADVLFGTVIVASGQSNMEFTVPTIFGGQDIVHNASLSSIPTLRLLTVAKIPSSTPLDDVQGLEHSWAASSPATICGFNESDPQQDSYCVPHCGPSSVVPSFKRPTWGYFSAMGWLTGRQLMLAHGLKTVGVVATSWGGTKIELWSDPESLAQCAGSGISGDATHEDSTSSPLTSYEQEQAESRSPGATVVGYGTSDRAAPEALAGVGPSELYNGMLHPLLGMPVRGFLWYQGEANSGNTGEATKYACQLPAMVTSWRQGWVSNPGNRRETEGTPFVAVQLAPWVTGVSVADLRLSQYNVTSAGPGASWIPAIDRRDPESPCGDVHVRGKLQLGQRVAARLAASWGLGNNDPKVGWGMGPLPSGAAVVDASRAGREQGNQGVASAATVEVSLSIHVPDQLPLRLVAVQNQTVPAPNTPPMTEILVASNTHAISSPSSSSSRMGGLRGEAAAGAGDSSSSTEGSTGPTYAWQEADATLVQASHGGVTSDGSPAGKLVVQVPAGVDAQSVVGVRYAWSCVPQGEQVMDAGLVPMGPWAFLAPGVSSSSFSSSPWFSPSSSAVESGGSQVAAGEETAGGRLELVAAVPGVALPGTNSDLQKICK